MKGAIFGGAGMAVTLGIAWLAVPVAKVPVPPDIDAVAPSEREAAAEVFRECGGGSPILAHEYEWLRFELYPRGEWKSIAGVNAGDVHVGCLGATALEQLRAMKGDAQSTALEDLEWRMMHPGDRVEAECGTDKVACYDSTRGGLYPETHFTVDVSGVWQLVKRDIQTDMIVVKTSGQSTMRDLTELEQRTWRASWKLVPVEHRCDDMYIDAMVAVPGKAVTWTNCGAERPDPDTQRAVDKLFELYRAAYASVGA